MALEPSFTLVRARAVLKLLHDAPPLLDSYRRPDSY